MDHFAEARHSEKSDLGLRMDGLVESAGTENPGWLPG